MRTVEEMKNLTQDLIASYDAQVEAIRAVIDHAYQAQDDFKDKRIQLSDELKETLATGQSLRKKDFDRMMNEILLNQKEKEKEVKQSLKNFIEEQKRKAGELKDALAQGEVKRMKKVQIEIEKGVADITRLLKDFGKQQKELMEELRRLLTKGKDLKIKDFKDTIRNFTNLKRGKEVKRMGLHEVAADIKSLAQDMATSHTERADSCAERVASVEALSQEIGGMVDAFQKEHAERKTEVGEVLESFKDDLHKGVHQFMKGVHQFMKGIHAENVQNREEVNDLLASFQEHMKGVRKENTQRQKEVNLLLGSIQKEMEGFRKENEQRQNEVGTLVAAVKEMWSTVARAKGGARKISARGSAETGQKRLSRRERGKSRKTHALSRT